MGDNSGIEWTNATWNPVVGCTAVSAGCDNCYAAREASSRLSGHPTYAGLARGGVFTGEVRLLPEKLEQPMRWRRPRRIFVNSMSDLFHPDVPLEFIVQVFAVMHEAVHHTFQVLTKRPGPMASILSSERFYGKLVAEIASWREDKYANPGLRWPLPNVWLGTSVENQRWADVRIPPLLRTPAAKRFLSCEPLLGPVDLRRWLYEDGYSEPVGASVRTFRGYLDWVIVGGESGPYKVAEDGTLLCPRPMHPAWARSLRDQCTEARVAFLFKQWGEWSPQRPPGFFGQYQAEQRRRMRTFLPDGTLYDPFKPDMYLLPDMVSMYRVGKRAAGRELDGRTWDQYPEAA